tara:strand:+ start:170 stop:727 length:558 start_codon:yes stop_codon:yes gene_type:complete
MRKVFFLAAGLSLMITQTGCFGSFELVKKVYEVNDGISNNKFIKSLIFWIGGFVYGIAGFLDAVIFNLIEFWTGSNPIAMEEGQYEEQLLTFKGETYKIVATKNQMTFLKLQDGSSIDLGSLKFDASNSSWNFEKDNQIVELIRVEEDILKYSTEDGVKIANVSELDCIVINENWISTSFAFASK